MRTRKPLIGYLLIALLSVVLFPGTCHAETIIGRGGSIEGFGKLTWGISAEEAGKAYPDLNFSGYEIEIRASLQSKIGPRTLVTRAETSWNQLAEYLVRKYGAPKEHSTRYVTEYLAVVKEMHWEIGGVFIHLNYRGPERADEDQLIFEMGK
ncbi:MAG: hypothetical protein H6Q82_2871 [Deltaproteobacteria bacterium]|nr:hypothetical protein [Deltaproteobacteria bacterium]